MDLKSLKPPKGSRKKPKRVGRGMGSGVGKTCGRGHKGVGARSGGKVPHWYEGGQMPIQRRLPKRGFANRFRKRYALVNVRDLARFDKDSVVDEAALKEKGLIKQVRDGVKILAVGEIDRPLTVKVAKISGAAREKIEAAGGRVEVV
jgi:large subunit ribosomal protein L15